MDVVSCECESTIRPYHDAPDVEVPVRWYQAPPDAEDVGRTAFGSPIYSPRRFWPQVGLTYEFNPTFVGNPKGYLGVAPCGTEDAFRFGVSLLDPPEPCDCEREPIVPVQEVPGGTVDGVNKVFTLSQMPISAASVLVFNGLVQVQASNYTISGQTITFSNASRPTLGSTLYVYYWVYS